MFGFQVIAGPPAKLKILKFDHSEVGMKNACLGPSVSVFHVQILNTEFSLSMSESQTHWNSVLLTLGAWSPTWHWIKRHKHISTMTSLTLQLIDNIATLSRTTRLGMKSFSLLSELGHFPFVRSGRPAHSRCNDNFTFNQSYPARSVKF